MFAGVHEPVDHAEEGHGRCDHTSVILGPVRKRYIAKFLNLLMLEVVMGRSTGK